MSGAGGNSPERPETPRKGVVFRDLVIFQLKLALDGLGDLVFAPLAILAYLWDLIPGGQPGRAFYAVLRLGERWDRWLTLYRPAKDAEHRSGGLLDAGLSDANSFIGGVEEMLRRRRIDGVGSGPGGRTGDVAAEPRVNPRPGGRGGSGDDGGGEEAGRP